MESECALVKIQTEVVIQYTFLGVKNSVHLIDRCAYIEEWSYL